MAWGPSVPRSFWSYGKGDRSLNRLAWGPLWLVMSRFGRLNTSPVMSRFLDGAQIGPREDSVRGEARESDGIDSFRPVRSEV